MPCHVPSLPHQPVKELGGDVEGESVEGGGGTGKGHKRLSVERIYQRKTQLEHILLRPDTYVGSTEESTELIFVYDSEKEAIVKRSVTFVPGLYKIYDEILGGLSSVDIIPCIVCFLSTHSECSRQQAEGRRYEGHQDCH